MPKWVVVLRQLFFLAKEFDSLGEVKFIGFKIILKPARCTFRTFNVLNITWGRLNLGEGRALNNKTFYKIDSVYIHGNLNITHFTSHSSCVLVIWFTRTLKVLEKASCSWKVLENWRVVGYPWKVLKFSTEVLEYFQSSLNKNNLRLKNKIFVQRNDWKHSNTQIFLVIMKVFSYDFGDFPA